LRVESIGYNVKGHRKIHKNFASIRVKNIIYIFFKLRVIGKYGKKNVGRTLETPPKQIAYNNNFKKGKTS
jgi:hypothetical protein